MGIADLLGLSSPPEDPKHPDPVAANAPTLPIFTKLSKKRVVLSSASPRRKQILEAFGLTPEVVPSTFQEDLTHGDFEVGPGGEAAEKGMAYACATAKEKAVEVYMRLVRDNPDDPPDLVIGADTVVLLHLPSSGLAPQILEKPLTKKENLRMLLDITSGGEDQRCEVVTGVTVVYPCLESPGYRVGEMAEVTRVFFGELGMRTLEAYVETGEGIDRAGGFAVQGLGGHLIRRIDGDYNNVVGFPGYAFFQYLKGLMKDDGDFLAD